MWASIWHLRGVVRVSEAVPIETLLDRIEQMLESHRTPINQRDQSGLVFNVPLLENMILRYRWAMAFYDRGQFLIEKDSGGHRIIYDLRSLHVLAILVIMSVVYILFGNDVEDYFERTKYAALIVGLYGVDVIVARIRIPRLIRRAVNR